MYYVIHHVSVGKGDVYGISGTNHRCLHISTDVWYQSIMAAPVVLFSNFKGGCGKTALSFHLAHAATHLRVLTIDTDPQGDMYKRFPGVKFIGTDLDPSAQGAVHEWRPFSWIMWNPLRWVDFDQSKFDLVIVDSGAKSELVSGPRAPDVLVIPISGIDAAINSSEIAAAALAGGVRRVVLVYNGLTLHAAGKRAMAGFGKDLPPGVVLLETTIAEGRAAMEDTAVRKAPLWAFGSGKVALTMYQACTELLHVVRI